jgi:predicted ATP-dependent serine protease
MDLNITKSDFIRVADVKISDIFYRRLQTGITKIDEFMSGGFLPGSSFTLAASPGTGKTTLMLQILESLAKQGYKVGYISGEENIMQVAYTCQRIKVENVMVRNETNINEIKKVMQDFDLIIIDSFQCLTVDVNMSSVEREKYILKELLPEAKSTECVIGFIMHMTKDGKNMKGSTLVPHSVDANLTLDIDEEGDDGTRVLGTQKNRFGSLNQVSLYMGSTGYDFDAKIEVFNAEKKAAPKKDRKAADMEKIMNLGNEFTIEQVMPIANGDYCRAQYLLRNLLSSNKLTKSGRGNEAKFQVIN